MYEGFTFHDPPKKKQAYKDDCLGYFRKRIDQVCEKIIFDWIDASADTFTCNMCPISTTFYSLSKLNEHLHNHTERTIQYYLDNYFWKMDY